MLLTFKNRLKHPLTSPLPICISFLSFFCLLPQDFWTRVGRVRPPCLVPDVSKNDSRFSPLITMLALGLLTVSLLHWDVSPVFLDSPELLSWRDARFCQWPFLHLMRQLLVSVFRSTYMMLIDLHTWNHPQISGIKQIWSMCLLCEVVIQLLGVQLRHTKEHARSYQTLVHTRAQKLTIVKRTDTKLS